MNNRLDRTKCPVCNTIEFISGQLETQGECPGFWKRCNNCGLLIEVNPLRSWPDMLYENDNGILPDIHYRIDEPKIARVIKGGEAIKSWHYLYDNIIKKCRLQ